MINVENYLSNLIQILSRSFGNRLVYVGLQGSYLRAEATQQSDIDVMVVVDNLSVNDLTTYRAAIQALGYFELSCGFICSKQDLNCWNPLEIGHLLNSTKDYYGSLCELVPAYTEVDIRNFVKLSINNLYHEICHRYIHADEDKNIAKLPLSYKGVFYVLQNLYFLMHGRYILEKQVLLSVLDGISREVLEKSIELSSGAEYDFQQSFTLLFTWCQETLQQLS